MRLRRVFAFLAASIRPLAAQDAPPTVVVDRDDVVIDRSCRVVVPPGVVIADANRNGVVRIATAGIRVDFTGATLEGAPRGAAPETFEGCAVRVEGAADVTLVGLSARGFRTALHATRADRLRVEGADVSDNRAARLRSTPDRCDEGEDWLWPHRNDANEWLERYGAGIYVEDSTAPRVERVRGRRTQNGIVLDRVVGAHVLDCDVSFLSGWGLALWRTTDSFVARNAFDFCVRGYSHGVYNRGQDSAGILLFEQCSRNTFFKNSVTHGGDGLFGFAGREAIGEDPAPTPGFDYRRRGCNDNLFFGNDFSFAPAHGLELTFSFGNEIVANVFESNAICGVWGGYSQDTRIESNAFKGNGEAGYGLERGGVNIDSGAGTVVRGNTLVGDRCGVHLWGRGGGGMKDKPWGRANPDVAGERIEDNAFANVDVALHVRGADGVVWRDNRVDGGREATKLEDARLVEAAAESAPTSRPRPAGAPGFDEAYCRAHADAESPVGRRARLRGRDKIVMGDYGPWDHASRLIQPLATTGRRHVYRIHGLGDGEGVGGPFDDFSGEPPYGAEFGKRDRDGATPYILTARAPGVVPYRFDIANGRGGRLEAAGVLVNARWDVRFFPWAADPRVDEPAWRAGADGPRAVRGTVDALDFAFGHGGPSDLRLGPPFDDAKLPAERFGCLASSSVAFPAGRWRLALESDDGVRLKIDGRTVVDDWTWHPPKRHEHVLELPAPRDVAFELSHFEIDGFAVLRLGIAAAP